MRSRLVIPAAILVAAAYVKGRQDASLVAPSSPAPAPAPRPEPGLSPEAILRAEAEAADAWELGLAEAEAAATIVPLEPIAYVEPVATDVIDLSAMAEWSVAAPAAAVRAPAPPPDDPALLNEWCSPPAAPAEETAPAATGPQIDEGGRFSLGGFADQPGHMALCGVTFRRRLDAPVEPARIRLVIEAASNVSGEGLVVLADEGFAPDREGFTLLLAAGGPGAFAVSGRYVVLPRQTTDSTIRRRGR